MTEEVWAQESEIKGLRLIRFHRLPDGRLKWIGPVGEIDCSPMDQFVYFESELVSSKWQKL